MPNDSKHSAINPLALVPADAAKLLTRVGARPIGEALLRADMDAGAPKNADGTINLLHYAAWLLKEMGRAD